MIRGYYGEASSLWTGERLLWVITTRSVNPKTGPLLQQTILRADIDPAQAVSRGQDDAVCGDCPRRWARGGDCYVNVGWAPYQLWHAIHRRAESFRRFDPSDPEARRDLCGRPLRLGAYGDPALIAWSAWEPIQRFINPPKVIGFTHQWRHRWARRWRYTLMASVDSEEEYWEARRLGWRTFRVRESSDPVLLREFVCPASKEAGHRLTCADCMACHGAVPGRALVASPVIRNHSGRRARWEER